MFEVAFLSLNCTIQECLEGCLIDNNLWLCLSDCVCVCVRAHAVLTTEGLYEGLTHVTLVYYFAMVLLMLSA